MIHTLSVSKKYIFKIFVVILKGIFENVCSHYKLRDMFTLNHTHTVYKFSASLSGVASDMCMGNT